MPCNVGKGNEKGIVENGVGYVKKNLLNGLCVPDFNMMAPVAQNWLDTVANVLNPMISVWSNRHGLQDSSGSPLIPTATASRLCFYHENKLMARHVRSYDRLKDFEHPDHPKAVLAQRKKAQEQKIFMRFLTLSDKAKEYYRQIEQRRMNPFHHIRQIVALAKIYPKEKVALAIEDAFSFSAFSCDYIANILEQRSRFIKEPGVLRLTRSSDLLDLTIEKPDMSIYTIGDAK